MPTRLLMLGLILAGVAFFSCSDDDEATGWNDEFSFELTAGTVEGDPVPNLRVSIWSLFDGLPIYRRAAGETMEPQVMTVIGFDLPQACSVSLAVYDLAGGLETTLVAQPLDAGVYSVAWNAGAGSEVLPDGVYRGVFRAASGSGEPLFQDTICMVLWRPDPEANVYGYTDAGGRFTTRDILRFPHLFPLPPLRHTNEVGTELGTFSYRSWVMVSLKDTATGVHLEYLTEILNERNQIDYTWTPAQPDRAADLPQERGATGPCQTEGPATVLGPPPTEFRLCQNYPNPFN